MDEAKIDHIEIGEDDEIKQGQTPGVDFWTMNAGLTALGILMRDHGEGCTAPDPDEFETIWWAYRRVRADARHLQVSLEKAEII